MVGQSKLDKNNCLYLDLWVCVVYMNDGPYVWVFAFIKAALCFFLRFWRQRIALMKKVRKPFPLNLNRGSVVGFMTSSEKSFWVVDGMTFGPWKK